MEKEKPKEPEKAPEQDKATEEIDDKIAKITEAAKRLEDANHKAEILLGKQILAGQAEAGAPQAPADESPRDYVKRVMGGNK